MLLDLSTGRALVVFQPGKTAKPADLWDAVLRGGFTPDRVESDNKVYKGPDR